ncbi:MAG: thiol:disulfide interchange protein DsbA/DsbL, partial [Thiogranum sp.]
ERFVAGEHYFLLERPVPTRDSDKIEVVEMFSYGCPHCYEFDAPVQEWSKQQSSDVDFQVFPAVWNKPMELYARAFYTVEELNAVEKVHQALFSAIVIEQKSIRNESDLAEFFAQHGVDKKVFTEVFNSTAVKTRARYAEERVRLYKTAGAPEIIVNGKYRIDRMRAGGLAEMLTVADFLIDKERRLMLKE